MTQHHDTDKRPHGETGDTVQQAAEVSRPTTSAGRALDNDKVPQAPVNADVARDARAGAGTAGAGNDAAAGHSDVG